MGVRHAYLSIVEKFQCGQWDAECCTKAQIQTCFNHSGGLGVDFEVFATLYRRAACEKITLSWKETRLQEKAGKAPRQMNVPQGGVFDCCFLSSTLDLTNVLPVLPM